MKTKESNNSLRYEGSYLDYNQMIHMSLNPYLDRFKDKDFAREVYAALCNMRWQSIYKPEYVYSCSWRYAGGLIAEIRGCGEIYLDFYCSGGEGIVTERVQEFFKKLGYLPLPWEV